ncbi:MAG: hypothetical protein NVS3B18_15550 [Candidatus Dormibacteria bacterium]
MVANGCEIARGGFALPGLRSAVTRNLLRRRLRETVRPLLPGLAGRDLVVVAGADATQLAFAELRVAVTTALAHARQREEGSSTRSTTDNADMTAPPGPR